MLTRRLALIGAVANAATLWGGGAARALTPPAPSTHLVRITGFAFVPDHLEVRAGDTIRWVNDDLAPHTATATEFGWDTGELGQNQSAEIPVTQDMETRYFCVFHPHMTATLRVS